MIKMFRNPSFQDKEVYTILEKGNSGSRDVSKYKPGHRNIVKQQF